VSGILGRLRDELSEALRTSNPTALARRLRVDQSTVWHWLHEAKEPPRAESLAAVVRELGLNGHWLLTGEGHRYARPEEAAEAVYGRAFVAGLRRGATLAAEAIEAEALRVSEQVAEGAAALPPRGRARRRAEAG